MKIKYCDTTRGNAEILMKMLGYKFKDNYSEIGKDKFPYFELREDEDGMREYEDKKSIHLMNYTNEIGFGRTGQIEPDAYLTEEDLINKFKEGM